MKEAGGTMLIFTIIDYWMSLWFISSNHWYTVEVDILGYFNTKEHIILLSDLFVLLCDVM